MYIFFDIFGHLLIDPGFKLSLHELGECKAPEHVDSAAEVDPPQHVDPAVQVNPPQCVDAATQVNHPRCVDVAMQVDLPQHFNLAVQVDPIMEVGPLSPQVNVARPGGEQLV